VDVLTVDGGDEGGRQLAGNSSVEDISLGFEAVDYLALILTVRKFLGDLMEYRRRIDNYAVLFEKQLEKLRRLGEQAETHGPSLIDIAAPNSLAWANL